VLRPISFPDPPPGLRAAVAAIAEELDAHRKARMAAFPHLTLTRLYNVLAAIRAGTKLSPEERDVHDAGQVTILRTLHDRLDAAAADAYGWPRDLSDAEIVARVVALNAGRAAEEAAGTVRWLRPAYQAPMQPVRTVQQTALMVDTEAKTAGRRWPKDEPAQFVALRAALRNGPIAATDIARRFKGTPARRPPAEDARHPRRAGSGAGVGGRAVHGLSKITTHPALWRLQAARVVLSGKATVSTVERSSRVEAWSISNPTTSPVASKSTFNPSATSRTSAPGCALSSM
jgi:hypothetical protein